MFLLQSTFGEAAERAGASTGDTRPGTWTDRQGGEGWPVTAIWAKVIISSTRSEEGKLPLKYFSRMMAPIHENCTALLLRAVRRAILKPNLLREIKWQHQAEIFHHQNQQNIWWTLKIVLNVIFEALVQSKKVFYGSRETSCSQGWIKSSFWN